MNSNVYFQEIPEDESRNLNGGGLVEAISKYGFNKVFWKVAEETTRQMYEQGMFDPPKNEMA